MYFMCCVECYFVGRLLMPVILRDVIYVMRLLLNVEKEKHSGQG